MSTFQEIQNNVTKIALTLKKLRAEINEVTSNPKVSIWLKPDVEKYRLELESLSLPVKEISSAKTICTNTPLKILNQIAVAVNEAGDLQVDLTGPENLEQASLRTDNLAAKLKQIETGTADLFPAAQFLIKSEKDFSDNLTLHNLLKLANSSAEGKRKLFDKGLAIFLIFFPDPAAGNNQKEIDLSAQKTMAGKLKTRLLDLDFSKMPNLAEEIIHHRVERGLQTVEQLSFFIMAVEKKFAPERQHIIGIQEKLTKIKNTMSLPERIDGINALAKSLCVIILGLAAKRSIYENINLLPACCEHLNVLHLSIKNSLVPQITSNINTVGFSINPATVAAKKTKAFFFGFKGLIRTIRLMASTIKGKKALNEVELQQLLEKAIISCRIFYGSSNSDINRIKAFIDGLLKDYARPFPHLPLGKLVKATIADYVKEVENYISTYAIDEKYRTNPDMAIPAKLGPLSDKIENDFIYFSELMEGLK